MARTSRWKMRQHRGRGISEPVSKKLMNDRQRAAEAKRQRRRGRRLRELPR